MKKLVEKPKEAPGEEENEDDLNGNVEVIGNDDDEWQVSYFKNPDFLPKYKNYSSKNI